MAYVETRVEGSNIVGNLDQVTNISIIGTINCVQGFKVNDIEVINAQGNFMGYVNASQLVDSIDLDGDITASGVINGMNGFKVNGIEVIDANRNITTSGVIRANGGITVNSTLLRIS